MLRYSTMNQSHMYFTYSLFKILENVQFVCVTFIPSLRGLVTYMNESVVT